MVAEAKTLGWEEFSETMVQDLSLISVTEAFKQQQQQQQQPAYMCFVNPEKSYGYVPHVGKVSCWGFSRGMGWIIHCYGWSDLCILRIRAQFNWNRRQTHSQQELDYTGCPLLLVLFVTLWTGFCPIHICTGDLF